MKWRVWTFLSGVALATTGAGYWHPVAAGATAVAGALVAIWATSRGADLEAFEKQAGVKHDG